MKTWQSELIAKSMAVVSNGDEFLNILSRKLL
jgi:hypothetical protein